MNGRLTTEEDIVADLDVSAQYGIVRKCNIIAHRAVVADVRTDHEKATIANLRHTIRVLGADVHRDTFPNFAMGADCEACRPATILDRLRWSSKGRKRINDRARADRRMARDVNMGNQATAFTDRDVRAYNAIGTNRRSGANHGA